MTEIIKESMNPEEDKASTQTITQVKIKATSLETIEYVIYFLFGVLELFLAFRFVLKLAGANIGSGFVNFVYDLTGIFIKPFVGIFQRSITQGSDAASVFEPSTLIAIIVYVLLAWGIVKLIRIFAGEQQQTD